MNWSEVPMTEHVTEAARVVGEAELVIEFTENARGWFRITVFEDLRAEGADDRFFARAVESGSSKRSRPDRARRSPRRSASARPVSPSGARADAEPPTGAVSARRPRERGRSSPARAGPIPMGRRRPEPGERARPTRRSRAHDGRPPAGSDADQTQGDDSEDGKGTGLLVPERTGSTTQFPF